MSKNDALQWQKSHTAALHSAQGIIKENKRASAQHTHTIANLTLCEKKRALRRYFHVIQQEIWAQTLQHTL